MGKVAILNFSSKPFCSYFTNFRTEAFCFRERRFFFPCHLNVFVVLIIVVVLLGGGGAHAVFASDLLKLCCGEGGRGGVPARFFFFCNVLHGWSKGQRTNNRTMPLSPKGSSENRAFVCEVQV